MRSLETFAQPGRLLNLGSTVWLTLLFLLAPTLGACAQLAPEPDAPPAEARPHRAYDRQKATSPAARPPAFELTASLVDLYFTVTGPNKKTVPNLTESDCAVYQDNVKQALQSFTARSNRPLTLGLLLDTSLSQQRLLPLEQQAAAAFLRSLLRPTDEAFLISFDVDVTMLSDFTRNPSALKRALGRAGINASSGNYANGTIPSIGHPKGTLLYDAAYLAAHEKLRHEAGRKALVLVTGGEDEGSRERLKSALEAAQKANTIVYVLLVRSSDIDGIFDDSGTGPMRKLAQATGGQVFNTGSNGRKMQAAFHEIETELRSEYRASYTPLAPASDGSYRRIRVACQHGSDHLRVQSRQGYYAAPRTAQPRNSSAVK